MIKLKHYHINESVNNPDDNFLPFVKIQNLKRTPIEDQSVYLDKNEKDVRFLKKFIHVLLFTEWFHTAFREVLENDFIYAYDEELDSTEEF